MRGFALAARRARNSRNIADFPRLRALLRSDVRRGSRSDERLAFNRSAGSESMKFSVFAVAIVVLLAGLFHFFEPKAGDPARPAAIAGPSPATAPQVATQTPPAAASG